MIRHLPSLLGLALLATVATSAPHVRADDKSDAAAMFAAGKERFKRHDFEGARAAFLQAWAHDPQPKYLWDLAAAELSDHPADALRHFRHYLALPAGVNDEDRRKAAKVMAEAQAKTVRVVIEPPSGAVVTADGQEVTLYADHIVDLSPGKHAIQVRDGGRTANASIEAKAGDVVHPELLFEEPPAPPVPTHAPDVVPPPPASSTPEAPPAKSASSGARWAVSGGIAGVGVVGLAAGAVFLANAGSEKSSVTSLGMTVGNCANVSSAGCSSLASAARSEVNDHNVGVGLLLGGGALVVAGIVTWIVWPRPESPASSTYLTPVVTPRGASAVWGGSF